MSDDAEIANELEGAEKYRVSAAWPGVITEESGFVAVPMALLRMQAKLKITPTEFGVLINIIAHRWKAGDASYPRTSTIAKRMGSTPRTVQRATGKLVEKGLIQKVKTPKGLLAYDATPLAEKLKALMPEASTAKANESFGV